MYCPICGAKQATESNFCPTCGTNLANPNTGIRTKYANPLLRFIAFCIDFMLFLFVMFFLEGLGKFSFSHPIVNFIPLLFLILYSAIMESSKKQATVGKMVFRMKVSNENGTRLSFLKSLIRSVVKIIFMLVPYIQITALFNKKKKTVHDFIFKTMIATSRTHQDM